MCQWSAGLCFLVFSSRGGMAVPAASLISRWWRLCTMPASPRATTRPMLRYHSHGVRPRVVRPPPVLAARETFLFEDALPIAGKDLTGAPPGRDCGDLGGRPA